MGDQWYVVIVIDEGTFGPWTMQMTWGDQAAATITGLPSVREAVKQGTRAVLAHAIRRAAATLWPEGWEQDLTVTAVLAPRQGAINGG